MRIGWYKDSEESPGNELESEEAMTVAECLQCSFGQCEWHNDLGLNDHGCPTSEWECQLSKLAEYPAGLPDGCGSELAQYLRLHPASWHSLKPKQMELLVADVFRANYGDSEVLHVGRPDDGGVDVIFVESDGTKWLIQVKSHGPRSGAEGVGTIRNLLGAILIEGVLHGVVVTNADHFTYRAYEAANRAHEKGYRIRLIDRGILNRMLPPLLPLGQWRHFVRRRRPDLLRFFGARLAGPHQLTLGGYLLGAGQQANLESRL